MTNEETPDEWLEVKRTIAADPATIFRLLCDPQGHVAIDSSGMLQSATGNPVTAVGDSFVVHMDRESLNDYPMGLYDVTVTITSFAQDRELAWTILGQIRPQIGHIYGYKLEPVPEGTLVTSYYDWSSIDPTWKKAGIFPVISELALRATLGILARTVAQEAKAGRNLIRPRGGRRALFVPVLTPRTRQPPILPPGHGPPRRRPGHPARHRAWLWRHGTGGTGWG